MNVEILDKNNNKKIIKLKNDNDFDGCLEFGRALETALTSYLFNKNKILKDKFNNQQTPNKKYNYDYIFYKKDNYKQGIKVEYKTDRLAIMYSKTEDTFNLCIPYLSAKSEDELYKLLKTDLIIFAVCNPNKPINFINNIIVLDSKKLYHLIINNLDNTQHIRKYNKDYNNKYMLILKEIWKDGKINPFFKDCYKTNYKFQNDEKLDICI